MTQIAVNVADLTRYDSILRSCMVTPVLQPVVTVKTGPNLDDTSVVLQCPEERAEAIVIWLRELDRRQKRYPLRAYVQGPRGGWKPLRTAKVL